MNERVDELTPWQKDQIVMPLEDILTNMGTHLVDTSETVEIVDNAISKMMEH